MSRFSTTDGQFVGWGNVPHLAVSLWQAIMRKATGRIPRQPWIPFTAQRALARTLRRDFRVWEIGSGFSTLWLSDRVAQVTSIEASREWHERLSAIIREERITNVDLRREWRADQMADFSELPDGSLDLLFIDGGPRGLCLERGFAKVRSGGYVYLDNWDTKEFWGDAADFPKRHAAEIACADSFVDYVPAQVGVYEGLLLTKS